MVGHVLPRARRRKTKQVQPMAFDFLDSQPVVRVDIDCQEDLVALDRHRFREELFYQLPLNRAKNFSFAYFLRSFGRLGSRKIHKVDTGKYDDEESDDGKNIHILYIAQCIQS